MTPHHFLLLLLGATVVAVGANLVHRRRRQRRLVELARSWRMHYSGRDLFQLARHIAPRLPLPGAADVYVGDVIYGIEGDHHRYIFSVEYTLGVVHAKQRIVRAASFREPKGRTDPSRWSPVELVEMKMPLLDQYRTLHAQHAPQASPNEAPELQ